MPGPPPWCWSPCENPVWEPPPVGESGKLLSVVSWDAGYRESRWLKLSFDCLKMQENRDNFEFFHINWGSEPNPEVLKYDFINVVCMDLPLDLSVRPSFDSGLQWSMGMYVSPTPYVMFFHNDIMVPNQLVKLQKKIEAHPDHVYFEGYCVNQNINISLQEFNQMLDALGSDFVWLPERYRSGRKPSINANLLTVHRDTINEDMKGWIWNHAGMGEYWCGPGRKQPIYGNLELREKLLEMGKALIIQTDMGVFSIPHERHLRRERELAQFGSGVKHWAEFVKDWLPQHPYRIVSGPRKTVE